MVLSRSNVHECSSQHIIRVFPTSAHAILTPHLCIARAFLSPLSPPRSTCILLSSCRHSGRSPSAHDRRAVYACDHGAIGDGVADDTIALQSAIDAARSSNGTLRLTDGQYRITSYLDWGEWTGISVVGDGAGQWGTHGVSIWADGVNGTAHDFTGSAYGTLTPLEQIPLHGLVALSASHTDSESEHDGCKLYLPHATSTPFSQSHFSRPSYS